MSSTSYKCKYIISFGADISGNNDERKTSIEYIKRNNIFGCIPENVLWTSNSLFPLRNKLVSPIDNFFNKFITLVNKDWVAESLS